MSSIPAINRAAAESIAAGNEPMVQALMTGMKLTHILQVYTSSMVSLNKFRFVPPLADACPSESIFVGCCGRMGLAIKSRE